MDIRHGRWIVGAAAAAVSAVVAITVIGQPAADGPRTVDGKPALDGIWQVRNTAWADVEGHVAMLGDGNSVRTGIMAGLSVVEGGEIPYLPEGLATRKKNQATATKSDPVSSCFLPGTPRVMYLPFPFQIFHTPKYVTVLSEYARAVRIIHTDGSRHLEEIESWMGDSRGRWEGDVLVVDVRNLNDQTWFDMAGNHHSAELRLTERFRLADADTLMYEVTVEDPKVYSRQWKMRMPIYRHKPAERDRLLEYECGALQAEAAGIFMGPPTNPLLRRPGSEKPAPTRRR